MKKASLLFLATLIFLASCAAPPPPPGLRLTAVSFGELPGWREDNHGEIIPALKQSCTKLKSTWCEKLGQLDNSPKTRQFIETHFQPFKISNGAESKGTFTGYYQVETTGSLKKTSPQQVPLLETPKDLVEVNLGLFAEELKGKKIVGRLENGKLKPYFSRAEIEAGALKGNVRELVWLNDPIEAHLLHVQGSGIIKLDNGQSLKIGFAQSNGLSFKGITRILIDKGKLQPHQLSMLATRDWLRQNPQEAKALMAENPRYIFFRRIEDKEDGPIGAADVPLTPLRSMAVDNQHIPLHSLLWLDSADAEGNKLRRLMLAQDTGAAIKGVVRGDFFWGRGETAFNKAAAMKSLGEYYILKPKE